MPPAWAVSHEASPCARRAWPGTVRVVFGKALAAVALILLAAPVGASADTVWTGAGNGVSCGLTCPTGVLALGSTVSMRPDAGAYGGSGMAVDAEGNVYFSDNDRKVKRIRPDGIIETIAGNGNACIDGGNPCGDGGLATAAQITAPIGVDVAPNGDVFIVDYIARKVRKVRKSDGVITTVAGNGQSGVGVNTTCGFEQPTPIVPFPECTEPPYVMNAANTGINQSQGIVVASNGIVYFAEADSSLVRKLIPNGSSYSLQRVAPGFAWPGPVALALDPSEQFLYVTGGNQVRLVNLATNAITVVAGSGLTCSGNAPCGDGGLATVAALDATYSIAVDPSGAVYIGQDGSGRIRKFTPGGIITTVAGTGVACVSPSPCGDGGAPLAAQFKQPRALAYDPLTGRLWISGQLDPRIRFIAPAPGATTEAAQGLTTTGGTMAATLKTDGLPVTYRFEYGPTAAYGFQTTTRNADTTRAAQVVTQPLSDLVAGATVHYRIVATDAAGVSTNGADVAFTVLTPGPGVGPTTAKITSTKLAVKWKKSVPSGTLEVKGTTDSAANLTVTLRRVVASGTKPVKGWTVKRAGAGNFSVKLPLPKSTKALLPGNYRVDITGSSAGGKVPLVAKSLKLKGPKAGIAVDGYIAAIKNGAPATRLPGKRPVVWAMFTFAALPTKGAIRVEWIDQNGKRHPGSVRPRRLAVSATYRDPGGGDLASGRYQAILMVGKTELWRLRFRLG